MIFGWQGFEFELPDDFAPVCLSGDPTAGYVRFEGDHDRTFQVRWVKLRRDASVRATLLAYLARLERDARKRKRTFTFSIEDDLRYRYKGETSAWGGVHVDHDRAFLFEAGGKRKDSVLPVLLRATKTFAAQPLGGDAPWLWSVFDLAVRLPSDAKLAKSTFHAGRTELQFIWRPPKRLLPAVIRAQRWGFASRLLKDLSLRSWARAALGWKQDDASEEATDRVRLTAPGREALALHDPDRDRIVMISVDRGRLPAILHSAPGKGIEWRPQWDWIGLDVGCLGVGGELESSSSESAASSATKR